MCIRDSFWRVLMAEWSLTGKPYAVQMKALERAEGQRGFGFGMEMGLGKTAVALSEYISLYNEGKVDVMLVLCPHTLKHNWEVEAKRFVLDPKLRVFVWRHFPYTSEYPTIWVVNHEAFKSGNKTAIKEFMYIVKEYRQKFYVAIDESIVIKNPRSKLYKELMGSVYKKATYIRLSLIHI